MDLDGIKKLVANRITVNIEDVSDDVILREVDRRGLHMGVAYKDIADLTKYVVLKDWDKVHALTRRLARDNMGVII